MRIQIVLVWGFKVEQNCFMELLQFAKERKEKEDIDLFQMMNKLKI
jgi:hypothetical protein